MLSSWHNPICAQVGRCNDKPIYAIEFDVYNGKSNIGPRPAVLCLLGLILYQIVAIVLACLKSFLDDNTCILINLVLGDPLEGKHFFTWSVGIISIQLCRSQDWALNELNVLQSFVFLLDEAQNALSTT